MIPLEIQIKKREVHLAAAGNPYGLSMISAGEFAFIVDGMVMSAEEFSRGCKQAACAPPNDKGTGGTGGSFKEGQVGPILPSSVGTDVHTRTREMNRESVPDKFWNETMVKSAVTSGLAPDAKTGDDVVEAFVTNIRDLYDVMDKFGDDLTDKMIAQAALWYPAAGKLAGERAEEVGITKETSVAILAALSPGHDWDSNIQEHAIVLNITRKNAKVDSDKVEPILRAILEKQKKDADTDQKKINNQKKFDNLPGLMKRVDGKKFNSLSVEDRASIIKAFATQQGEDFGMQRWGISDEGNAVAEGYRYTATGKINLINFQQESVWAKVFTVLDADKAYGRGPKLDLAISAALGAGAKVRSFNNNIGHPEAIQEDVTIDTHATSVVVGRRVTQDSPEYKAMSGGLKKFGEGLAGPYIAGVEAYRQVSRERKIMPRAAQSQTWVARKGLNDYIDGSPTTDSIRKILANPKKIAKLPAEAVAYFREELVIREAWGRMFDKATKAGYTL